jgi:hypothetical protein
VLAKFAAPTFRIPVILSLKLYDAAIFKLVFSVASSFIHKLSGNSRTNMSYSECFPSRKAI